MDGTRSALIVANSDYSDAEPAHVVSLAVEEFFADRKPDDLLVLHFSCHGVKDEDGELYFATA